MGLDVLEDRIAVGLPILCARVLGSSLSSLSSLHFRSPAGTGEGCLKRTDEEEASRILEASGHRRLKANLEIGRRVLKLLKKSVLSVSS